MLNSLPASTCKFAVLKMAFSHFLKDPSNKIRLVNISTKLSESKFWYDRIHGIGLDLSFQTNSTV